MAIKICLNNEIHRFSKLPVNLKALIDIITSTFQRQLPSSWGIYYVDSDGDKVTLSHDQDYQDLIETEAKDSSTTLKLFIVAREGGSVVSSQSSIPEKTKEIPSEKKKPVQEIQQDYQVIAGTEEVKTMENDLVQKQKQDVRQPSQNTREKTAQADYTVIDQRPSQPNEARPRAHPQPLDEGSNRGKMHEAKHLFKKLSKRDVSGSEKTRMSERLTEIEQNLTSEEKAIYEQKREKWARKATMKQGRGPRCSRERSGSKPRGMHKVKRLFWKLSREDISEDKRARITEKLQKIEESLTPEEKSVFAEKKEKWAKWASMSQSRCRGGSRGRSGSKQRGFGKAKHLFKKLSKKDISEEKRARITEKLQNLEENLTPEEKSIFAEKKEKWAAKAAMKRGCKRGGSKGRSQSKDSVAHEAKHLFKKLSKKDMPEEKKAMLQERLKQIEEALTPEQKAVFDQKKEKWQRKAEMRRHFRHHRGSREEIEVQTDEQGRPIHTYIPCVNCKTVPIVGIRYKCAVCHHFDLCETCEATVEHPHPVLKIKSPAMMMMLWKRKFSKSPEGRHGGHWGKHGGRHGGYGGHHGEHHGEHHGGHWGKHGGRHGGPEGRHGKPFKVFKMFRILDKMADAVQTGDFDLINFFKQKSAEKSPEEVQKILEPVFALTIENTDQEALKKAVEQAKDQLLSFYHPEDKEQILERMKQFQGRPDHHHGFHHQRGHGFHHHHGFKKGFMKGEGDQM